MFTTHTKLNIGLRLRLQRGPELDGDLERELYQNRAQLDAHPVSSVAVLRFRQQVVVARAERASRAEDDDGYHRRRRGGVGCSSTRETSGTSREMWKR